MDPHVVLAARLSEPICMFMVLGLGVVERQRPVLSRDGLLWFLYPVCEPFTFEPKPFYACLAAGQLQRAGIQLVIHGDLMLLSLLHPVALGRTCTGLQAVSWIAQTLAQMHASVAWAGCAQIHALSTLTYLLICSGHQCNAICKHRRSVCQSRWVWVPLAKDTVAGRWREELSARRTLSALRKICCRNRLVRRAWLTCPAHTILAIGGAPHLPTHFVFIEWSLDRRLTASTQPMHTTATAEFTTMQVLHRRPSQEAGLVIRLVSLAG